MLFDAAEAGDVAALAAAPDLTARQPPYGWTLLHVAAHAGQLDAVRLLLERGLDVNAREEGDNSYAMHWAAAAGHLEVVRVLADAGGDVIGAGDDHALEVIGWATCFDACHADVAEFLVSRGARHHVWSAIAMGLEPRAEDVTRRMSRNEEHQTPLHFAVRKGRTDAVRRLLSLGADPLAVDAMGRSVADYANTPDIDRPVMQAIRELTLAELESARRGAREPRLGRLDAIASLALGDFALAARSVGAAGDAVGPVATGGAARLLPLMSQRGDLAAVRWLLERGADPDAGEPLHLAASRGHTDVVRALLDAGADPRRRDAEHDSDAVGWAVFFGRQDIAAILRAHLEGRSR
jgi:ankyrin repeat protein